MIKTLSQLESSVEGKTGRFLVENDTPITSCKEMLRQFQELVEKVEKEALAAQAKKEETNAEMQEESKPE